MVSQAPNRVSRIWDTSAAIGGPIVRDTLWFFQANRYWGTDKLVADAFWEIDPTDAVYEPDLNRQAVNDQWNLSNNLRLTYQVNPKNRVAVYFDSQRLCMCHFLVSQGLAPEATERWRLPVNYHGTATWTAPLSNRLLLEAGFSATFQDLSRESQPLRSSRNQFGFREQSTGVRFRAPRGPLSRNISFLRAYKTSLSYVTGSHVFKVGVTLNEGSYRSNKWANLDAEGAFLFRGTPFRLLVLSTPYEELERLNAELGLYVQDSWTLERWTLNLGARFDYLNSSVPAQNASGGTWVGPRSFEALHDVPNWRDFWPRVGVVYDLFGNGKTAIKATLSRYVQLNAIGYARGANPFNASFSSATRSWNDVNGDLVPQADELGPLSNANFGTPGTDVRGM